MLPLYERIEKLCKDNGTNITQMCKSAGVQRSALSDYKSGKNKTISFANLQKIADYFGMTVDELVNGNTKQPSFGKMFADTLKNEKGFILLPDFHIPSKNETGEKVTLDDFTYAMYNHSAYLTDEEKKMLLEMAEFMKKKRGN